MDTITSTRRALVRALAAFAPAAALPALALPAAADIPLPRRRRRAAGENWRVTHRLKPIRAAEAQLLNAKAAFAAAAETFERNPPELPPVLNYLVVGRQGCSWREESRLIDGAIVGRSDKLIGGRRAPRFVRTVDSIADDIADLRPEQKAKRKALRKLMTIAEKHRRNVEAAERRHGLHDLHAAVRDAERNLIAVCAAAFDTPATSPIDLVAMAAAFRAHAGALPGYGYEDIRRRYARTLAEATIAVLAPKSINASA